MQPGYKLPVNKRGRSGYKNILSYWRAKKRRTQSSLTDISEEEGVGRGEGKVTKKEGEGRGVEDMQSCWSLAPLFCLEGRGRIDRG